MIIKAIAIASTVVVASTSACVVKKLHNDVKEKRGEEVKRTIIDTVGGTTIKGACIPAAAFMSLWSMCKNKVVKPTPASEQTVEGVK